MSESRLVKSCPKLESGLRLGQEGIHACQIGPFSSPIFWTAEEAAHTRITRAAIAEKRRWLFELLNDDQAETPCKSCQYVCMKRPEDVRFDRLGHIDLAATTTCNLRCRFCGYTTHNGFAGAKYDVLAILREYGPEDILWDSAVDFNGGEPTLLKNFDAYIDYFTSRRIRVFLYTNGTIFRQAVYDGLASGAIRWVCTSLDAGTPSTYRRLKKSTLFTKVMENLTRYAHAGSQCGGRLAVKYIFHPDNCGGDDIAGFTYGMLAIRPQAVWLTFDFEPLACLPGDQTDLGGHDYALQIAAYARTYVSLRKHGFVAEHFAQRHLAVFSRQGQELLRLAMAEIERLESASPSKDRRLLLGDFRNPDVATSASFQSIAVAPLRTRVPGGEWSSMDLTGKRIALAPACALSRSLLGHPDLRATEIVCFLDRDTVLHGKTIDGVSIAPYASLSDIAPDIVLVAAPREHQQAVAKAVLAQFDHTDRIYVLDRDEGTN